MYNMMQKNRNLSRWISSILVTVLVAGLLLNSDATGFPIGGRKQYLPLIVKDYTVIPSTPVGPVGGTFTAMAVDPNQPNRIYAGSYVSGVYKTYDQGETWYRKNAGLGNLKIQSLATHPTNSAIVYAGTYGGGISKSLDGGESWIASNGGVLSGHIVYDIEIDPNNGNVIYAATRVNPSLRGFLYKTSNGGVSWKLIVDGNSFSTPDYFYDIDVNPVNSNELYLAAHEHGFYKSNNAGQSFVPINKGVSDHSARSFAIDTAYPGLVYGAAWHGAGVYRTWSGGTSWASSVRGLPSNVKVFRLVADPFGGTQKRVFACTYGNGLYSSDNFAQSWTSRGLAGQRLYDFVVAGGSPQRWFAATESNGIFRVNADGGGWKNIMGDLRLNAVTAMAKDEDNAKIYVAVYGKGVYSVDSTGLEWVELTNSLEDKDVIDLAISTEGLHILTETGLYLLDGERWSKTDLPLRTKFDEPYDLDTLAQKVGLTRETIADHFEQNQAILASGSEKPQAVVPYRLIIIGNEIYVGTIGNGLFMRVGDEWEQVGFAESDVTELAFDPSAQDIFAIACGRTGLCEPYRFASENWTLVQKGIQGLNVNKLLSTERGMLAATSSGLYRFDDKSEEWILIGAEGWNLLSLSASTSCGLAMAGQGFAMRSSTCGETWQEIPLENWSYQTIGFLGDENALLLIGSRENGAFVLPFK